MVVIPMEINQIIRLVETVIPSNCELTNEELVGLIQKGVDKSKNLEILYAKNIKFIVSVAMKYSKSGSDVLDLIQEGFFGLYKAVQKFSCDQGTKFLTFAGWEIQSSMQKYVVNTCSVIRFPARWQERLYRYIRFVNQYVEETGEEPSDDLVKTTLQITAKDLNLVKTYHQMSTCASLDMQLQVDDKLNLHDSIAAEQDVEEEVLSAIGQQELKQELWKVIDSLPSEDAFLVKQVFQKNKPMTEIAPSLGISQQATSQRMKKILMDLEQNEKIRNIRKQYFRPIESVHKKKSDDSEKINMTAEMVEIEKMFVEMNDDIFKELTVM